MIQRLSRIHASDSLRQLWLFLTVLVCVKGLGGAFHGSFAPAWFLAIRSPFVGTVIALMMIVGMTLFRGSISATGESRAFSPRFGRVFVGLYLVVLLVALGVRWKALQTPLDRARADMLPVTLEQIDRVLGGNNPYTPIVLDAGTSQEQEIFRPYLPGIWGGYLPLRALGWDIRLLNVAAQMAFYILLLVCFWERKRFFGLSPEKSGAFFLILVALHAFSKQSVREVVDVQTGPFWLSLSVLLWAASKGKLRWIYWTIPAVLLCRQPALLLVLPFWMYLLSSGQWRELRHALVVAMGVIAVVCAPFVWTEPRGFLGATLWHLKLGQDLPVSGMLGFYGLSGPVKLLGLQPYQLLIQALGLVTSMALAWQQGRRARAGAGHENFLPVFALGGAAYVWFILFATVTFPYLFAEPLILVCFLLVGSFQNVDSGYS